MSNNTDNTQLPNWNWNFSITNQAVHDHALGLLAEIAQAIPKVSGEGERISLLTALIETSKRLIEREEIVASQAKPKQEIDWSEVGWSNPDGSFDRLS